MNLYKLLRKFHLVLNFHIHRNSSLYFRSSNIPRINVHQLFFYSCIPVSRLLLVFRFRLNRERCSSELCSNQFKNSIVYVLENLKISEDVQVCEKLLYFNVNVFPLTRTFMSDLSLGIGLSLRCVIPVVVFE